MADSGGTAVTIPRGAECSPPCGRLGENGRRRVDRGAPGGVAGPLVRGMR